MNLLFKEPKLSFCTLNFEQYKYVKESKKELLLPDLTPAGVNSLYMGVPPPLPGVMGWLTGQKLKPISGEQISITIKFDHDLFPSSRSLCKRNNFPFTKVTALRTISFYPPYWNAQSVSGRD